MSSLTIAILAKVIGCPACNKPITRTENYQSHDIHQPQIGGSPIRMNLGEEVTLVCENCGFNVRTNNWREYATLPPQIPT